MGSGKCLTWLNFFLLDDPVLFCVNTAVAIWEVSLIVSKCFEPAHYLQSHLIFSRVSKTENANSTLTVPEHSTAMTCSIIEKGIWYESSVTLFSDSIAFIFYCCLHIECALCNVLWTINYFSCLSKSRVSVPFNLCQFSMYYSKYNPIAALLICMW